MAISDTDLPISTKNVPTSPHSTTKHLPSNTSPIHSDISTTPIPPSDSSLPTTPPIVHIPSPPPTVQTFTTTTLIPPTSFTLNTHPMTNRAKNGIYKTKALQSTLYSLSMSLNAITIPPASTCVTQANKDSWWWDAMAAEIFVLMDTRTWTLVPPSPNQNIIGCKWIYRMKQKADGIVDRFKTQLVTKGFTPQFGIDYEDTFSQSRSPPPFD